jgi:hypothetical protein
MDSSGFLTSLMVIIGPILLAAVILWAVLANRNRSRAEKQHSEAATRDLYKTIDREDKAADAARADRRDA